MTKPRYPGVSQRGTGFNMEVRANLGGRDAARNRVTEYQMWWPRKLVAHCDEVLARPMPDVTFEALADAVHWRSARDTPESNPVVRNRLRQRIRARALRRLQTLHDPEYRQLYEEEWQRETAAPNKETA